MLAPIIHSLNNLQLPMYPSVTGVARPITAVSLAEFGFALAWAGILLLSFTGWGRLTGKLFRVPPLPASVACSMGIAAVIFLGGWLNLFNAIYVVVLYILIAIGIASYVLLRNERPQLYKWSTFWNGSSRWVRILIFIVLLILVFRIMATVRLGIFNVSDDSAAYLVFPQKMLALHHFASDPFSDRRLISSLGGSYFLQDLILAALSPSHLAIADRTLGLILLAAALFDLGTAFGLSTSQIALMEFLAYLVPQETMNLTFVILPLPLLLAMIWLMVHSLEMDDRSRRKYALLAGFLGGAIISLKSTYLPIVGAYISVPYLVILWKTRRIKTLQFPVIAGVCVIATLLSWMIAMKLMSGTYLFPILGSGGDYSAYGLFDSMPRFTTPRAIIKVFLQAAALSILIGINVVIGIKRRQSQLCLGILIGSALAITAFNYKSGGDFVWRYNFPQFFCAIIVFYVLTAKLFREQPRRAIVRFAFYAGVVSLAGMTCYYDIAGKQPFPFRQLLAERKDYLKSLRTSLSGMPLAKASIRSRYKAFEAAIPSDATVLENVGYPFLFNYQTHKILVMDWPGAASPPPGWPFGQSAEALATYLRKNSVNYIAYDYRYNSWNDAGACKSLEQPQLYSKELYVLFWMAVLSNHQLNQLRRAYRSIYDNGEIALIDLEHPRTNVREPDPVWTFTTDKEQMCSEVTAQYWANPLPDDTR